MGLGLGMGLGLVGLGVGVGDVGGVEVGVGDGRVEEYMPELQLYCDFVRLEILQ